jgi:pyruvate/2-oxoglutarate dehydrogenase complex dihydrolipoamide acyltransferase (E2) component
VQSDKATIEITSRYKGKVAQFLYVPGDIVKVRISCFNAHWLGEEIKLTFLFFL